MILDTYLEFADATSVGTPNNSTVTIGYIIDLTASGVADPGQAGLYFVVQVTTAIGSGGAATVSFQLASDSTTTIAVDGSQTIHYTSDVFALATLVAGFTLAVKCPTRKGVAYERYLAFQIIENAGQALNAGAVNAFLTSDVNNWTAFADATN